MIGACDICDRQSVPVSHFNATAVHPETNACFICQGEESPDPYGEMEGGPWLQYVRSLWRDAFK